MKIKTALDGLKVFGVTYAGTANMTLKTLGMHGATVVRVESIKRPCNLRMAGPFKDNEPGIDRSGYYAMCNNDRYSMALNLKHPQAGRVLNRLVEWADVFVENFTPGAMKRAGLDYETVKDINPSIIMLSISQQGQTGPHKHIAGYGPLLQGLSGHDHLTGWPDRSPILIGQSYPDFIAPAYASIAVMAALDHRQRTGLGQYVDLSNYECCIHWLATSILDCKTNERIQKRQGNRVENAAPHNVYRCLGDDAWCAITVYSDAEWSAFCQVIGNPPWTRKSEFSDLTERKKNEIELDRYLEQWTKNRSPEDVMTLMQAAGISAGKVQNCQEVAEDPQINHRNYFRTLDHAEMGPFPYPAASYLLSKTPAEIRLPFPCLGEHTEHVCRELLGMPEEEFVELLIDNTFE